MIRRRLVTLTGSTLLAVLALEGLLRLSGFSYLRFFDPDPLTGITHRKSVAGWYSEEGRAYVRFGPDGLRGATPSPARSSGTLRIAVLGDSFAEALQVDESERFSALLPVSMRGCAALGGRSLEVINFAVSDFGTAQELVTYRRQVRDYRPDIVLLAFFTGNDIRNNSRELDPNDLRPYFRHSPSGITLDDSFSRSAEFERQNAWSRRSFRTLADWSRVIQLARKGRDRYLQARRRDTNRALDGTDAAIYRPPDTAQWTNAWAMTEQLLRTFHDDVQQDGAAFLLVTLSNAVQVDPDPAVRMSMQEFVGQPDLFYADTRLATFAKSHGIDVLTLAPAMQRIAEARKIYLHGFRNTKLGTGHWNADGHAVASELIGAALCALEDGGRH